MRLLGVIALIWLLCGCGISTDTESDGQVHEVTFADHIAPIVHANCTPCHRPGQAGPFSLITYKDVRKRAKTIKLVTGTKFMPPWPADRVYRSFAGERGLEEEEIALIADWVNNGAPLGDARKLPTPPVFPSESGLGEPDLVIKMAPYTIEGNNKDHFVVTKIPIELDHDTTIRAIEFVPDNSDLLHHMNAHLVNYEPGAKTKIDGGERFVDSQEHTSAQIYKLIGLLNDDGSEPRLSPSVCNYLPGVTGILYPENIGGWRVSKKSALLIKDIHYGPTPKEQTDQSTFNIFFASKEPERPIREVIMGTLSTLIRGKPIAPINEPLEIPPGIVKKFSASLAVSRDLSLLTLNPHMHLLGKSFLAYAVDAVGDTIPLVKIPRWDFRWQYFYTFKKMLRIPKGSTIHCEGEFDNTSNNENNPFDPPQTITGFDGSMKTTDEMFQLIVSYLVYQQGDENISLEGIKAE
jgi:hypothetical protein